jgi:hypothetical protein
MTPSRPRGRARWHGTLAALVVACVLPPGCSSSADVEPPRCLASAFPRAVRGTPALRPAAGGPFVGEEIVDVADASGDRVVAQRAGQISRQLRDGAVSVVADLTAIVGAGRVLGVAVAPASLGGDLFVSMLLPAPSGFEHVVDRLPAAGPSFDVAARRRVLTVPRTDESTVGGRVAFGPDDKLYVPVGDSALQSSALDPSTRYGKVLRIDVSGAGPYTSPPDNPFADGASGLAEVWATGLRDPGRPAFDVDARAAWITDVGEAQLEVNRLERGASYGWPTRDGRGCGGGAASCPSDGSRPPEMSRAFSGAGPRVADVVTPRGETHPLRGRLVLLDRSSSALELVDPLGPAGASSVSPLLSTSARLVASSGEGLVAVDGERVVDLTFDGSKPAGAPASLLATGCAGSNASPGPGALPYEVASPLWSDGAEKKRWVFLPPDAKIGVKADGDLELPVGAVVAKTFIVDGKNIETRLLVQTALGAWDGYSYEWKADQSDAELLPAGKTKDVGVAKTWTYPSRVECTSCHTAAAGFTLGLELRQLGKPDAADRFGGLAERMVAAPDAARYPAFPSISAVGASDEAKARAYLHTNRPGAAPAPALIDLRADVDMRTMDVCAPPLAGDLGLVDARIVAPGAPARSVLAQRMRSMDHARMPKLGSRVVDAPAADVIDAWIRGVTCP